MAIVISDKLVRQCVKGEHLAQMELYSILFRSVYSASLRIVGNSEDALEIAQESFLKFFRNIERYHDKLPHVIRRMAVNASIDLLRRRKVDFVDFSTMHDTAIEDDQGCQEEQNEQCVKEIMKAIEQLPTGYRLVITLRLIEDLSFDEIASEMGISCSTARSQYTRAKQKLIELLKKR